MNRYWDYERRNRRNNRWEEDDWQRNRQNRNRGGYQFDDYGDPAHGAYGNEGYRGTYGNQGDERASNQGYRRRSYGSRDGINEGAGYGISPNYGSMGSYGGAQGFGTSRSGYSGQKHYGDDMGSQFYSGRGESGMEMERNRHRSSQHQIYGAYRDMNSYSNRDRNYGPSRRYGSYDPYGTEGYGSMRGMQDYDQNQQSSYDMGGRGSRSRNYQEYDNRSGAQHSNYRPDYYGGNTNRGDYMGSGYSRQTHGEYGPMLNYGRNYESYYQNRPQYSRSPQRNIHEGPVRSHSRID